MAGEHRTCGNYVLVERIAKGGMAEVYLGRTTGAFGVDRLVAVKMLLPMRAESKQFVAMFIDEARLAVELTHINIVQIFELGVSEGRYYIAMEYVPGSDLAEILRRLRAAGEPMPIAHAVYIAYCICAALDYAHTRAGADGEPLNIVHRDVSPQNILIGNEGGVKVADFGIALSNVRLTQTVGTKLKGKVCYMSPEQAWGRKLDARSDQFSVGTILYEMLTGVVPFDGATELEVVYKVRDCQVAPPRTLRPELPEELEAVVLRAMSQDPSDRFASADEMHAALEPYLLADGRPFGARDLRDFVRGLREDEAEQEREHLDEVLAAEAGSVEPPADWSEIDVTQIIEMEVGESAILAVNQPWAAETGLRSVEPNAERAEIDRQARALPDVLVGDGDDELEPTRPEAGRAVERERGVTGLMARMPTRDMEELMSEVGTGVFEAHLDEDGTGVERIESSPPSRSAAEVRAAFTIDGDEWWTVSDDQHKLRLPGKESKPAKPRARRREVAHRKVGLFAVGVSVALLAGAIIAVVVWPTSNVQEPTAPAPTEKRPAPGPKRDPAPAQTDAEVVPAVEATRADVIRLRRGLASLLRGRGLTRGDSSELDEHLARLAVAYDVEEWGLAYEQAEAAMTVASEVDVTARMVRSKLVRMQRRAARVENDAIRERLETAIVEGRALLEEGEIEDANVRLYEAIMEGFAAARASDGSALEGLESESAEESAEPGADGPASEDETFEKEEASDEPASAPTEEAPEKAAGSDSGADDEKPATAPASADEDEPGSESHAPQTATP